MGTHELGTLQATVPFDQVVGLLGVSAGYTGHPVVRPGPIADITIATLNATTAGLEQAKTDQGLIHSFYLLAQLTQASRNDQFFSVLERLGLPSPKAEMMVGGPSSRDDPYTLSELVASFTEAVDQHLLRTRSRTDIGELAQQSAAETLTALCRDEARTLFGSSDDSVATALRPLSTEKGFTRLTRDFFGRLSRRFLLYHLSRELSNHVGPGRRFRSIDDHNRFLRELDDHCRICTGMLKNFAGKWYKKANWEGGITPHKVKNFMAHAIDKMVYVLQRKGMDDGE